MKRLLILCALTLPLGSCALFAPLLDTEVIAVDPVTQEETTTTVGDQIADNAETFGQTAGGAVTTVTGNPIFGLMIAGAASALAVGARRKKKPAPLG